MTTQEFVNKEREQYETDYELRKVGFTDGLTKGLEIAKEFAEWVKQYWVIKKGRYIHKGDFYNQDKKNRTTSELLTIFLTEKYWNNG